MPPVESLKALVSRVMTERVDRRGRNLVLAVFDVSRAHFYGVCERDVYVEPPSELHRPGLVAKLNKLRCTGRRMRAMRGRNCGANTSAAMALSSVQAIQRCTELVSGFCHRDDFVTAAAEDQIESFGKLLQEKFDTRLHRHDPRSRTLGQRTGSVAQNCQSDQLAS